MMDKELLKSINYICDADADIDEAIDHFKASNRPNDEDLESLFDDASKAIARLYDGLNNRINQKFLVLYGDEFGELGKLRDTANTYFQTNVDLYTPLGEEPTLYEDPKRFIGDLPSIDGIIYAGNWLSGKNAEMRKLVDTVIKRVDHPSNYQFVLKDGKGSLLVLTDQKERVMKEC